MRLHGCAAIHVLRPFSPAVRCPVSWVEKKSFQFLPSVYCMVTKYFGSKKVLYLLLVFTTLIVLIKLVSLRASWIENYYTTGLYPVLSRLLRVFFGWIPFSIGDIMYTAAGIYLLIQVVYLITNI